MTALPHSLTVARTATYYQLGEPTAATRELWFVLHGYGQLAEFFIRHFRVLTPDDAPEHTVVIAPEALNRFYLGDSLSHATSRVGATWMTREKRSQEITDYANYLNQVYDRIRPLAPTARVTVLGFSQGTATASRWLPTLPEPPARLVLWAGAFPEDMEFAAAPALLSGAIELHTVVGNGDAVVTEESKIRQARFIEAHGLRPVAHTFRGGHTLDAGVLRELGGE